MSFVTIKDVGKEANVSFSTVSRVIRNAKNVRPETRKRVLEAIRKLNYRVDGIARGMVKKQTKTIGVCISDITNPYYPPLVRGVENTINKFAYNLLLCNTDESVEKEENYLELLLEKRTDGLIIAPVGEKITSCLKEFLKRNIPVVLIDRKIEDILADQVCVDNFEGAFIAVEHLIKLGHKRIAMIAGSSNISTIQERIKGYLEALRSHNIDVDDSLIVREGSKIEAAVKATEALFKINAPPTAIFCSNSLMSMGVLIGLKKLSKKVPEEVAVIGFDDLEWSEALNPPLTVVSQPNYAIGATAAQLLIQRLLKEGPSEKQTIVLKTNLIIRESCGYKS